MIVSALVLTLLLQSRPAVAPASVSGVVVQNGSNEPLPNVRVSLARTDAALGAFGQMVAGDHPPAEVTIPSELLAAMIENISGAVANGGAPPEIAAEQKAVSQLPIAEIQELVISVSGDVAVVSKSAPPIMTDNQGRFAFDNLPPGTYKLIFASNGYARQDYGQRDAGGSGIPIVLNAGQAKSDIVMRMSQVAAVGGRITDSSGFPIAAVPVQLFRFAYDESGQRKLQRTASTLTDDRGDYRMFHLSPGRYILNAGNLPGQTGPSGLLSIDLLNQGLGGGVNSNRIPEKYTLNYYPGVDDASAAAPIDIPPGADLSGLNMSLRVQQAFRIRGNIVDSRTGQPPPSASITLSVQTNDPLTSTNVNTADGTPSYIASDGTFELRNVSSGAYTISVTLPNPTSQNLPPNFANLSSADQRAYIDAMSAASASAPRASATINVVNSDVEGVQLRPSPGGSIAGRFSSDQDASTPAPEFTFLRLQLKAVDGAVPTANGITAQSRPAGADGTFRIDNIWQGEYRLTLTGLPAGYYLKEARLGDVDLLSGNLKYAGTETKTLNVVISPRTGQVDGTATNVQGQPVPGARVVLIPERNRERTELFRSVTADPSGHFNIAAVAPGEYKLASWEFIEPFAFFDRELLKQADDLGKAVRVMESSKQTINVTSIP